MKKIAQMIFLILISSTLYSQDLNGQWHGTLNVQETQFRIVFHVVKTDNQYKVTMDSPDQNANGIPVTATNFSLPSVKFEIADIGMVFEGVLSDNRISGKWMQSGRSFPLALTKKEDRLDTSK